MDAPFTQANGLPFPHKIGALDATGFIRPYRTDTPLAFLMAWLSLFRTSYFEDQKPIAIFYLQDMVNSSLKDMILVETQTPIEELKLAIEKKGLWGSNLDVLREKFPKRESEP